MVDVLLLALAAAVYPTLLAGVIAILSRPDPLGKLGAFLVGGMTFSVAAGLAILVALEGSGTVDTSDQTASAGLDIVAGLGSLAIAYLLATHRDRRLAEWRDRRRQAPEQASWWRTRLERGSLALAFLVGVVLNLPGIWYLAALKDISTGGYATAVDVLLVLGFNVVMFALVEIPLVVYVASPDTAQGAVDRFNAYLHEHARGIAIVLTTGIGAYLLTKGLVEAI